jgi:hypothetical protein
MRLLTSLISFISQHLLVSLSERDQARLGNCISFCRQASASCGVLPVKKQIHSGRRI